jgi:tetratricopeptide (TPR) repeat protein
VAAALVIGLSTSTRLFFLEKAARQRAVAAEHQAEMARANEAEMRRRAETREKITEATVLLNQERYDDADRLMNAISVTQPTVEGAAVYRSLGEYYALQNQWPEAARHFNILLHIDQLDGADVCTLDYLRCGPALVELADDSAYEHFRRDAVSRFADGAHPFADRIVKISLLLPADEKLMQVVRPIADVAAQSFATNTDAHPDDFLAAWCSVSLALVEYRSGNYAKAADWCERSLNYPEYIAPRTATARVILALADQRLGQTSEARTELAQAREIIENQYKSQLERGTPMQGFWFDWDFARILLREAQRVVPQAQSEAKTSLLPSSSE